MRHTGDPRVDRSIMSECILPKSFTAWTCLTGKAGNICDDHVHMTMELMLDHHCGVTVALQAVWDDWCTEPNVCWVLCRTL